MKYKIKSMLFKHENPSTDEKTSDEKWKKGIRPDMYGKIFDEDYIVKQYAQNDETRYSARPNNVIPDTQMSAQRPSVDLVDAAQNARKEIWKSQTTNTPKRDSVDDSRTAVDIVEAANQARLSRGKTRLPAEPERVDIVNPGHARRTSIGSASRYDPPGGNSARSSAAAETLARRTSRRSSKQSAIVRSHTPPVLLEGNEDAAPTERTLEPDAQIYTASPVRLRHSKKTSNASDRTMQSVTENNKVNGNIGVTAKEPEYDSVTHEIVPVTHTFEEDTTAPLPPPKSLRRSLSVRSKASSIDRIDSPVSIMDIIKPNGELHERYLKNTQEIHKDETYASAVVHERVFTKIHNIITTQITRDIHTHEVRQHIQPIIDKQYLPERHWIQTGDGRFVEVNADEVDSLASKYAHAMRIEESVSAVKIECEPFKQSI